MSPGPYTDSVVLKLNSLSGEDLIDGGALGVFVALGGVTCMSC